MGIFFRTMTRLEASRRIDTIVLDKTGTVTEGRMALLDCVPLGGFNRSDLLRQAGAVEQASEHLVGRAVFDAAFAELGELPRRRNLWR